MTRLGCIECKVEQGVLSAHVDCPKCGGLLDPIFDVAKLKRRSAKSWRAMLDESATSVSARDRSGVWAHHAWILPELAASNIVTLGEGRSPLVPYDERLAVKQCGQQPTGSFKDLGMTVLVSVAKAFRKKSPASVRALVCASTGDTSAALAAYGARAQIPVVVLLPKGKVSPAQLVQPLASGALVIELEGDFDACMRVVKEVGKRPGFLLANSKNPRRLLGQATVAFEIARDLGWRAPDVVIVPSGNLGNVAAMHAGFTLLVELGLIKKAPRLVAAQVAAADPLHRAKARGYQTLEPVVAGETLATAIRIGDPVSFPRARRALLATGGTTTSCSEREVVQAMDALDRRGFFSCPQTGAAMAGALQLRASGYIRPRDRVVVVSTASGLKFAEAKAAVTQNVPRRAAADVSQVLQLLADVA